MSMMCALSKAHALPRRTPCAVPVSIHGPFALEVDRLSAELKRSQSKLDFANADRARAERLLSHRTLSRVRSTNSSPPRPRKRLPTLGSIRGAARCCARLNLEFTQVRSPIDGHVSRALITAGNLVSSADVLTTVVSDDPIYAYFDTDEATYLKFAKLADDSRAWPQPATPTQCYLGLVGRAGLTRIRADSTSSTTKWIRVAAPSARAPCSTISDGHFTPGPVRAHQAGRARQSMTPC
jgi:multidrug efflux pump subunit AcrA (membrane-fusion protein)